MLSFRHMGIVPKAVLVTLSAVAALSYFAISGYTSDVRRREGLAGLTDAAVGVTALADAVHCLQLERGASSLLVATRGAAVDELAEARRNCDATVWRGWEARALGSAPDSKVRLAGQRVEAALALRKRVDSQTVSIDEIIDRNSMAIGSLLDLGLTAVAQSRSTEMSNQFVALLYFSRLKERAGLERALGAALVGGTTHASLQRHFAESITAQAIYLDAFRLVAAPQQFALYESVWEGNSDHNRRLAEMRRVIADGGAHSIDPRHWFSVSTARIDSYKLLETMLAERLVSDSARLSEEGLAALRRSAMWSALIAGLALLIIGGASAAVAGDLGMLSGAIARLTGGNHAFDLPQSARGDEIGALARAILTFRDHLDRAEATMASALDAIITVDQDGRTVDMNPSAEWLFGYRAAEVVGRDMGDLIFPAHLREQHRHALDRARHGQGKFDAKRFETAAVDSSGREFPIEMTVAGYVSGGQRYFTAFIRDLAEQKQATAAVRKLSRAIEQSPISVLITDRNGVIEYVNPKCLEVTGFAADDLIGRRTNVLKGNRTPDSVYRELWATIGAGREWHGEMCNRKKSGELYWERVFISPIRGDDGEIASFVAIKEDLTAEKDYEERLIRQATYDNLTNLPNRNLVHERIAAAIAEAGRKGKCLAVMFLDLDDLKKVNDTLGHDIGDELLVQVSERMVTCLRSTDTVARFGGDEFVVVIPTIEGAGAAEVVAQNILRGLSPPFHLAGTDNYVSASIGIALFPRDGTDPATLLKNADSAMYATKEAGGGKYALYAPVMQEKVAIRKEIEAKLRRAIKDETFALHYQPILDLPGDRVVGFEALLRWQDGSVGLGPDVFIPVAEQTGLILPIGRWALFEACHSAASWSDQADLTVTVNVSSRQLMGGGLLDTVGWALGESGLPPHRLLLEITESCVIDDVEKARKTFALLASMGVKIAIDDFGTGYSALSYLSQLPFSTLKIDRSFIIGLGRTSEADALTRAIVSMAHSLGLRVVAEGVETGAQVEALRSYGCDCIQGYLIGAAMEAEQAAALVRSLPSGTGHLTHLAQVARERLSA